MNGNLIMTLALVALLAIMIFTPRLFIKFVLRLMGEKGRAWFGRRALAKLPDRITLIPRTRPPGAEADAILAALAREGFQPAGSFEMTEMGSNPVYFMVMPAESAGAAIFDHPKLGVWFNLFSRYQNGDGFTLSTSRTGSGLEQRPGHPFVHAHRLEPAAAHKRFLQERNSNAMKSFVAADMPAMFIDAYAESMAWRKNHGISAAEVEKIAVEKYKH